MHISELEYEELVNKVKYLEGRVRVLGERVGFKDRMIGISRSNHKAIVDDLVAKLTKQEEQLTRLSRIVADQLKIISDQEQTLKRFKSGDITYSKGSTITLSIREHLELWYFKDYAKHYFTYAHKQILQALKAYNAPPSKFPGQSFYAVADMHSDRVEAQLALDRATLAAEQEKEVRAESWDCTCGCKNFRSWKECYKCGKSRLTACDAMTGKCMVCGERLVKGFCFNCNMFTNTAFAHRDDPKVNPNNYWICRCGCRNPFDSQVCKRCGTCGECWQDGKHLASCPVYRASLKTDPADAPEPAPPATAGPGVQKPSPPPSHSSADQNAPVGSPVNAVHYQVDLDRLRASVEVLLSNNSTFLHVHQDNVRDIVGKWFDSCKELEVIKPVEKDIVVDDLAGLRNSLNEILDGLFSRII